jgi:SAM-dependent methyltransferase
MTFPLLYHTHYSHHLEDLPLWLDLAERQGEPILELGCGTGRVLIPLIKAGHRVFGLDKDIAMLSLLKRNLADEYGAEFSHCSPVLLADLSCFHFSVCFSLILVPCNTWSTFDPLTRQRSLEQIYAHLSPNGLFVASVPNPLLLLDLPASAEAELEESFEHPLSGNPVQVSSSWERDKAHFTVRWFYDHLLPDGTIERLRKDAVHHLSTTENYLYELRAAGLRIDATWGDFGGSAYDSDSEYLILAAKKS